MRHPPDPTTIDVSGSHRPDARRCILAAAVLCSGLLLSSCGGPTAEERLKEAETALRDGDFQLAAQQAERAAKFDSLRTDALVLSGVANALASKNSDAVETLQRAWQTAPDHFYAAYFHGWSLARMHRYGDALAPLEKAVELRPDHTEARILLSRCCLEQNLPTGIEHLRELAGRPAFASAERRSVLFNDTAYLLAMADRPRDAEAAFDQALQIDPTNPRILQNKAILYDRHLNQPRTARRYYIRAIAAYQKLNEEGDQSAIRQRLRQLARTR